MTQFLESGNDLRGAFHAASEKGCEFVFEPVYGRGIAHAKVTSEKLVDVVRGCCILSAEHRLD
jgi:hypothetical protein